MCSMHHWDAHSLCRCPNGRRHTDEVMRVNDVRRRCGDRPLEALRSESKAVASMPDHLLRGADPGPPQNKLRARCVLALLYAGEVPHLVIVARHESTEPFEVLLRAPDTRVCARRVDDQNPHFFTPSCRR